MGNVLGAGVFHESELCEVEYGDVKIPAREKNDKIRSFVGETIAWQCSQPSLEYPWTLSSSGTVLDSYCRCNKLPQA